MHKLLLLVALMLMASCGSPDTRPDAAETPPTGDAAPPPSPPGDAAPAGCASAGDVLTGQGIGALRIGMSVAELAAQCTVVADTTEQMEGSDQRVVYVRAGADTVRAEVVDGAVWRLRLEQPTWKTADGVGVGTRMPALLALPAPQGFVGEGNLVVVSSRHCGLSFEVSASPYGEGLGADGWDAEALRQLPDTTRVTRVYVVGCS